MSDQKIKIEVRLAIQWHLKQSLQQAEQLDFNNASAIQLLDVLESHQISHSLKSISTSSQNNKSDMERLESKIDLLLMLFTRNQYNKSYNNIPNYDVCLNADGCVIKTSESIELNQLIEIDVFFNQDCPEPLIFSGKVIESESSDSLAIEFCNIGTLSQTYLEKYIFRQHRNEIARIKQS
jgi:hypothetical protein